MMRIRLLLTLVATAALVLASLSVVPGATAWIQIRTIAFVLLAPWVVALFFVPLASLRAAGAVVVFPSRVAGRGAADALDTLSGFTVAAGALAACGSFSRGFAASWAVAERHGGPPTWQFSDIALAASFAPLFAGFVWLVLYAPASHAIRRQLPPQDLPVRRGLATGWRLVIVVVVTAIALEAFRSFVFGPPESASPPAYDTAFTIGPAERSPARRIALVKVKTGVECRLDGQIVPAVPGSRDEIAGRVGNLPPRSVEISAARDVRIRDVVAAIDTCVCVRADDGSPSIRVVSPVAGTGVLRLRLARDESPWPHGRDLVLLQLPSTTASEPLIPSDDGHVNVNVTWDPENDESRIIAARCEMTPAEVIAWLRARPAKARGSLVLRCDKDVRWGRVADLAAALANLGDDEILLEVCP